MNIFQQEHCTSNQDLQNILELELHLLSHTLSVTWCDCLSKNVFSSHNYKYLEISIWNIQLNIYLEKARGCLRTFSNIQCLSVDQLCKRKLVELPAISNSFYSTITNDHIGVEVRGGGEPRSGGVFHTWKLNTARWSHLRPIWALDSTNSSQFDGQAFWPVTWWFPAGWILVHSYHCHLMTTWTLKHVRQAQENSPKKADQWIIGNDIHMNCQFISVAIDWW